jgi:hypothetical protein
MDDVATMYECRQGLPCQNNHSLQMSALLPHPAIFQMMQSKEMEKENKDSIFTTSAIRTVFEFHMMA